MERGFFKSLLDISFSSFVTPKVIKVLYAISLALIAIGYVVIAIALFSSGGEELTINEAGELEESGGDATLGFLWLLLIGPLWALLYALFARVFYEIVIVLFRIMENTRDQLAIMRGGSGPGESTGPTPERPRPE